MWTDLSLQPLTEGELSWATAVERAAIMRRTWTVGGFVPHPGVHAEGIVNGGDAVLVARNAVGVPQCLVWIYRRTTSAEHVYVSLLADPAAPPGFATIALAGALERHFRHQPDGEVLIEVAEPNLGPLRRLVSTVFDECARLQSAVWMDGGWRDLTYWRCTADRWRDLVDDGDELASAGRIVERLVAAMPPTVPGVPTAGAAGTPVAAGRPVEGTNEDSAGMRLVTSLLTEVARRDAGALDPEVLADLSTDATAGDDDAVGLDTAIGDVLDSLGALVLAAVVAELVARPIDDLLDRAGALRTFGDLVALVEEAAHVPA